MLIVEITTESGTDIAVLAENKVQSFLKDLKKKHLAKFPPDVKKALQIKSELDYCGWHRKKKVRRPFKATAKIFGFFSVKRKTGA